jgi:hypothetical protein
MFAMVISMFDKQSSRRGMAGLLKASSTSQFSFILCLQMKTGKMERFMKDLEILGLLVACVSFII